MSKKKELKAIYVSGKNGEKVRLLRPNEKGRKYADELKNKVRQTNDGLLKVDKNGCVVPLTDTQLAYRSGYLAARKDSANCFKSIQKKKQQNKSTR